MNEQSMDEQMYVDGNALAGPLTEVFAVDVTQATTTCVGCGRRSLLAQLQLYTQAPGTVARCPGCQQPVLRYTRTPAAAFLDLRGTISLSFPMND